MAVDLRPAELKAGIPFIAEYDLSFDDVAIDTATVITAKLIDNIDPIRATGIIIPATPMTWDSEVGKWILVWTDAQTRLIRSEPTQPTSPIKQLNAWIEVYYGDPYFWLFHDSVTLGKGTE